MTKRILGLGVAAAAAFSLALPAAPAQADHCWSWFTTPVQCVEDTVSSVLDVCRFEGTRPTCLPDAG